MRDHLFVGGRTGDARARQRLGVRGSQAGRGTRAHVGRRPRPHDHGQQTRAVSDYCRGAKSSRRSVRAVTMPAAALRERPSRMATLERRPARRYPRHFPSALGRSERARLPQLAAADSPRRLGQRLDCPASGPTTCGTLSPRSLLAEGRSVDRCRRPTRPCADAHARHLRARHARARGHQAEPDEAIAAARRLPTAESG